MENEKLKLVRKSILGDQDALDRLIAMKMKDIRALSIYFSNHEDYEDVMQEVLYFIVRDIKNLRDPKNFEYWLMSIIRNTSRNFLRKKINNARRTTDMFGEEIEEIVTEENVDFLPAKYMNQKDSHYAVLKELETLPDNYRKAIIYRYYDDLSYKEIAIKMGVKEKDVSNYLNRGRHSLKLSLTKKYKNQSTVRNALLSMAVFLTTVITETQNRVYAFVENNSVIENTTNKLISLFSASSPNKTMSSIIESCRDVAIATNMIMGVIVVGDVATNYYHDLTSELSSVESEANSNQEVNTLTDMIGQTNKNILIEYVNNGADINLVEEFLANNEIQRNGEADADDYSYYRYCLYDQEKQLIVAVRVNKSTNHALVNYTFGKKGKLPDMYEIITMFDR